VGDIEVARAIAASLEEAELFTYPGDRHLFTDDSVEDFDPQPAALVMERTLDLLARVDARR